MPVIDIKIWNSIVEKADLIKVYYYQALPIWEKIEPLLEIIENLRYIYDKMEYEYLHPEPPEPNNTDSKSNNSYSTVTKQELLSMLEKINKLSMECNTYLREGRPIALKMWAIYQEIINTSVYDDVRNIPDLWLINQDVYRLYINFLTTLLREIGHWTESGAKWIRPEY